MGTIKSAIPTPSLLFRQARPKLGRRTCTSSTACCGVHHTLVNVVAPGATTAQPFNSFSVDATSASVRFHRFPIARRRSCPKQAVTAVGFMHAFSTAAASTPFSANANERNTQLDDGDIDGIDSLPNLSAAMKHRILTMKSRHDELMSKLRDGGDQTALGKELSSLSGIAILCEKVADVHAEKKSLLELLHEIISENDEDGSNDEDSKEMTQEIKSELNQLDMKLQSLSQKMIKSLVPLLNPDNVDDLTSANAVIDIRAGTGGDEACLFASEIMAAYEAVAKAGGGDDEHGGGKAWELEVLSVSRTDLGGVKEASLIVSSRGSGGGGGSSGYSNDYDSNDSSDANNSEQDTAQLLFQRLGPYGFFQYESGVHRVQRVPINGEPLSTNVLH